MIFFEGVAGKLLPDAASRRTGAIYKNLTFHLGAGCHAIGGPTTDPQAARLLLELAAGHVRASRGKVRILTHAPGSAKVSADVVYVPRDVVLPEELTALAVVALDGKARGRANGANGAKGASAAADPAARLAALGLGDLAKRPVRTLSLPERRGVALAIAVTCGAKILLLEEPFVDACAPAVARLATLVRELVTKPDTCVLVATASRRDAASLGATVQGLVNERLVPSGYGVEGESHVLHVVVSDPMKLAAAFAAEGAAHTLHVTPTSVEVHTADLEGAAMTVARAAVADALSVVSMHATVGSKIARAPDHQLGEAAMRLPSFAPPPPPPLAPAVAPAREGYS